MALLEEFAREKRKKQNTDIEEFSDKVTNLLLFLGLSYFSIPHG